MRLCVFLLVFCCIGLSYSSLAASQVLDTPASPIQVGPTSVRNNKDAKHSLSVPSRGENGSIADSVHYLKSRLFGASTVQTYPSESVGDLPLQPSAPDDQTASLSENRLSSLRKAAQDKVASLPLATTRSLVVGPMLVDMHQPNVGPRVPVPSPISIARGEPTDPPLPDHCLIKPQQMSCPASAACQGKNLMYKPGRGTCEVACGLECYVDLKRKLGWACGSCSG
jgi:hypothetical protein